MSYLDESGAHEWGPGGQKSASEQIDIYEKSNKRQSAKNFLNKFATGVNESMAADRNRSSNTEAAQGGRSSSASKDSDDKVRSGMAKLGDDVSVQEGYRPGEWTMEGSAPKKGLLGHVARGAGAAFGGPWGAMAGNMAGGYLDYV